MTKQSELKQSKLWYNPRGLQCLGIRTVKFVKRVLYCLREIALICRLISAEA
jgi:hypothetical protein